MTDRSFWHQDHKDALPQGWGIKARPSVVSKKNPTHPLKVRYRYYPPAGGKRFDGLVAAKAAARKSTSASSSSRQPGASKRSSTPSTTASPHAVLLEPHPPLAQDRVAL